MPVRAQKSRLFEMPAARQAGKPLEARLRAAFEPRFGHDFSRVRVHTGEVAAQSARALHARAYTVGEDIVFGANQYGTSGPALGLLAHELAHVAQQRRGGGLGDAEAGAQAAVKALANSGAVTPEIVRGAAPGVYRAGEEETPPIPLSPSLFAGMYSPPARLKPPSILQPQQQASGIPSFSLAPQQPKQDFQFRPILPKALLPAPPALDLNAGPKPPQKTSAPAAVFAPLAKPQTDPSPEAPSRVSLFWIFGVMFAMPAPSIQGIPGAVEGGEAAAARMELYKALLTGNPPPGVDMAGAVKVVYSILSTYIFPDYFKMLARKFGGKPSSAWAVDVLVSPPSGKDNPSIQAKYAPLPYQAAGVLRAVVTFRF